MRKNNFVFGMILAIGLGLTGCGQNETKAITRVEQGAAQTENSGKITANAPKTTETDQKESTPTETPVKEPTSSPTKAPDSSSKTEEEIITEEEAKAIALKDAGVVEDEVLGIRVYLDRDDRRNEYDVEFYAGNREYDYEIDIYTGRINEKDSDIEIDFDPDVERKRAERDTISKEEAIEIVLKRVDGATEQNVRMELDEDDGRLKYEGEIHYNGKEYEFELNAATGEIFEWSEDYND